MTPVRERAVNKVRTLVLDALAGRRARVWLFGSCARGDVWPSSDIDVAIEAEERLPGSLMVELKEAMEEHIPFDVDIVDLRGADLAFRARVEAEGIAWQ